MNDQIGTESPDNFMGWLHQMGISDPRYQMIAEFMKNQPARQVENVSAEKRKIRFKRFIARYKQMKEEHEILMERNDILASALGACPVCWGQDSNCEVCRGKGVPGAYALDRDAFVEFVLPSIRKLGLTRRKDRSSSIDSGMTEVHAGAEQNNVNQSKEV